MAKSVVHTCIIIRPYSMYSHEEMTRHNVNCGRKKRYVLAHILYR